MKNYLFLLNALLLTCPTVYSMEEASLATYNALNESFPCDTEQPLVIEQSKVVERPKHLIEADAIVGILERTYQPGKLTNSMQPAKGILDAHQIALDDPEAVLQLNDKEREDLVKWYHTIYIHLSRMSPEEAKDHPLRMYKKRIYAAALKLYTSRQAAKQWLKSADCYTDEEKELDAFASQGEKPGYRRSHYLTAKHSLTIQKNRLIETKDLEKVVDTLKKESDTLDTNIAQLTQQLAQLKEQKNKNGTKQEKITKDMQATNRTVKSTVTIYDEQLQILAKMLQTCTEKIKTTEQELVTLKGQATNLPHKKEVEEAEIKEKRKLVAQLKLDQAAIKRDIDLLTDDYTIGKKVYWKLSGFLTSYPVEDALDVTPGNADQLPAPQDEKDKK